MAKRSIYSCLRLLRCLPILADPARACTLGRGNRTEMLFIASEITRGLMCRAAATDRQRPTRTQTRPTQTRTADRPRMCRSKKRSYPHIWMQLPFIQFAFFPNTHQLTWIDSNKFPKAESVSTESVSSSSVFPLDLLQYCRSAPTLQRMKSCCTRNFVFNGGAKTMHCNRTEWKRSVFLMPPHSIYVHSTQRSQ